MKLLRSLNKKNRFYGLIPVSLTVAWITLSGCAAQQTHHATQETAKNTYLNLIPYERFTLKNGLEVIVHEDRKAPVVAINTWYKVGSKHEPEGKTGFAHLFEHLMFNGSEHYDDDLFKPLEDVGAVDMNGTTNSDRTNYFQTVPTAAVDLALWLESDRMGHLLGAVTQEKLDNQRDVVKNEKRLGEERPYGNAYEVISKLSFPKGHPYSWTAIGSMKDLNAASLSDVHAWFKEYYGPNNAVLVLSGDIDVATARKKVEHFFGDIAPSAFTEQPTAWVPTYSEDRRYTATGPVPQARLYKVWNTPALGTEDAYGMEVLSDVLGNHANAQLHKRLIVDEQVATMVAVWHYPRPISGQFLVIVDAKPGVSLAKIEGLLNEELSKVRQRGISASDLELSVARLKSSFLKGIEKVGGFYGKANTLAAGAVFQNNPGAYAEELSFYDNVTPNQLKVLADKWLAEGSLTLTYTPSPSLSTADVGADRSKLPKADVSQSFTLEPFKTFKLQNGLKVIALKRDSVPLIEASMMFGAGYAADPNGKEGLASLAADVMIQATKSKDTLAFNAELSRLGAELSAGSTLNSTSIGISALKEKWEPSLALFAEAIAQPGFREEDLERLTQKRLADIQHEMRDPRSQAMREMPPILFGKEHPYGVPYSGTGYSTTVNSLKQGDFDAYAKKWMRPDNATLILVGDLEMQTLQNQLENAFAAWKRPENSLEQLAIPKVKQPKRAQLFVIDKPKASQSMIFAGLVMPGLESANAQDISAMNQIFGGAFTARLNMNIREDKGWAYYAYSSWFSSLSQAPWMMYSPVQQDKTLEAIREMQAELNRFIKQSPATRDELSRVKRNQLSKLPGRLETNRQVLSLFEDMVKEGDIDKQYLANKIESLKSLSLSEVNATARQYLKPEQLVWVVVGDVKTLAPKLKQLKGMEVRYL